MKIVLRVILTALVGAGIFVRVNADPPAPAASQNDPTVNPHAMEDADGIPLTVTHPELLQSDPAEMDKKRKAEEKAKNDKDWLLRGYEQEMHSAEPGNASQSFIDHVSSDRELSSMAGVPYLGDGSIAKEDLKTGLSSSGTISLRADPSQNDPFARASSLLSKPFYSSATALPGLNSTAPLAILHDNGANAPKPSVVPRPRTPPPRLTEDSDSMALTSPGLVAQEKSEESGGVSSNLTLNLPEDSNVPDNNPASIPTTLELPLKTNEERLHRQEAAMGLDALSKSKTIPIVKAVPYVPPEPVTVPITRPSMGRSAIADPRSDDYMLH